MPASAAILAMRKEIQTAELMMSKLPRIGQALGKSGGADGGGGYLLLGVESKVDAKGDTQYWAAGVPAMVQSGELVFQYPESPNHQMQAYQLPQRP